MFLIYLVPQYFFYFFFKHCLTLNCCWYWSQNKTCTALTGKTQTIIQKIQRYTFLLILPSPTLKKCAFGNILLDAPLVASVKPNAFLFLTEFMPFKLEYYSNFDNILVNSQLEFSFFANLTALVWCQVHYRRWQYTTVVTTDQRGDATVTALIITHNASFITIWHGNLRLPNKSFFPMMHHSQNFQMCQKNLLENLCLSHIFNLTGLKL